jgi:hypothetical protein
MASPGAQGALLQPPKDAFKAIHLGFSAPGIRLTAFEYEHMFVFLFSS